MDARYGTSGHGNHDVIVIGGSTGAVEAMTTLARQLPADLPAAVLVAIHRGLDGAGHLAHLLDSAGPLHATMVEEGQPLAHGQIYVAPPDRHLLVGRDHMHIRRGPRENRARPAVDPLFRSAAVNCLGRVIGVVLSGLLNDGASGLRAIKRCGGLAVVQDPWDAVAADMPRHALAAVAADHVLPLAEMGPLLMRLAATPCPAPPAAVPAEIRIEALIAAQELTVMPDQHRFGPLATLSCPDCHGAMQEIREGELVRYRCHTGHAFTLEALRVSQEEAWERTLYAAMRAQQEQAMLCRRLAQEARQHRQEWSLAEFERRAEDYEAGAETIRQLLAQGYSQAAGPIEAKLGS